MKRIGRISIGVITAVLLLACIIGGVWLVGKLRSPFEKTTIFAEEGMVCPPDTTFIANGIQIKMIGIQKGKINCKGLKETIELNEYYIGETEVTQELWMAIMGYNPSMNKDSILCPVENVDLVECLEFIHKLDSITGVDFNIQTYPQWLYTAHLGVCDDASLYCDALDSVGWYKGNSGGKPHPVKQKKPNALGIYDIIGNVSEWTISGSDPLFVVAGGGYESDKSSCGIESHEFDHAHIKTGATGLRLVCYPKR